MHDRAVAKHANMIFLMLPFTPLVLKLITMATYGHQNQRPTLLNQAMGFTVTPAANSKFL
jgi:hypothetical protein